MNDNVLPPHVIEARLRATTNQHQDGRSWLCDICHRVVNASWSDMFSMWLPKSRVWKGAPNVVEVAFCSAKCSLIHHENYGKTAP